MQIEPKLLQKQRHHSVEDLKVSLFVVIRDSTVNLKLTEATAATGNGTWQRMGFQKESENFAKVSV